jgi:hypothetical protein
MTTAGETATLDACCFIVAGHHFAVESACVDRLKFEAGGAAELARSITENGVKTWSKLAAIMLLPRESDDLKHAVAGWIETRTYEKVLEEEVLREIWWRFEEAALMQLTRLDEVEPGESLGAAAPSAQSDPDEQEG